MIIDQWNAGIDGIDRSGSRVLRAIHGMYSVIMLACTKQKIEMELREAFVEGENEPFREAEVLIIKTVSRGL